MKKAISIFLVCIMTFACIPVISFAATWSGDQTITSAATATTSNPIEVTSGTTVVTSKVTINEGATMTVKSGASLVVSGSGQIIVNGTLTIELGAAVSFVANGDTASSAALIIGDKGVVDIAIGSSCILGAGAYAYNSGIIKNIENMTVSGILQNKVTVPEDFDVDYRYTDTWNRENISVHFDVDYYMYDVGDSDLEYLNASRYNRADGDSPWVEYGNTIFILITPEDGVGDWIDTGRMKLSVNGQLTDAKDRINNDRGVFSITPTSAVNISVFSTAYKDIGKLFTIELPRTDAYYCITKDGDVDVATVEYGKTLSFRVVLSPDYDMSTIYAYANTDELTPDDYGYYDIEAKYNKETKQVEIVDGNGKIGIQGNVTISVKGAISNDRVNTASNLVSFIQEIFTIIKSIFEYFKDIFAGLGSLGGAIS